MPSVFICYRRQEASAFAGRLYDKLSAHFDAANVFWDLDTLEPGVDFISNLKSRVTSCDALFAVIGQGWIAAADKHGQGRLGQSGDILTIEIATALDNYKDILVIPLLIGGARMPDQEELPEPLRELARRQAVEVSDKHFHHIVDGLVDRVNAFSQRKREESALVDPALDGVWRDTYETALYPVWMEELTSAWLLRFWTRANVASSVFVAIGSTFVGWSLWRVEKSELSLAAIAGFVGLASIVANHWAVANRMTNHSAYLSSFRYLRRNIQSFLERLYSMDAAAARNEMSRLRDQATELISQAPRDFALTKARTLQIQAVLDTLLVEAAYIQ